MSTTTTYAYDKSHRMTTQYSSAEAHYFTYNERDMVTSIQDVKSSGSDSNRYFTYNGLGERVWAVDGMSTSLPTYFTYDSRKILTEKDANGVAIGRYRHNDTNIPGPALEVTTSDVTPYCPRTPPALLSTRTCGLTHLLSVMRTL